MEPLDMKEEDPDLGPGLTRLKKPLLARVESHFLRRISTGILVLIPLLITILVFRLVILSIDGFIRPLPYVRGRPWDFAGIGLLLALLIFYFLGALVASKKGRHMVDLQRSIFSRVPIVRNIYNVAAQATDTLSGPDGHKFKRVVLVEWPRPGVKAIGFVTGNIISPDDASNTLLVIYIPTAPNPTSGFVAFMDETDVTETEFTIEDAMKTVFSGGIVLPKTSQNNSM